MFMVSMDVLRFAMSILTSVCGLVLLSGAGTELYRGGGVIIMFGLLGTALVTLTVLKLVEQRRQTIA